MITLSFSGWINEIQSSAMADWKGELQEVAKVQIDEGQFTNIDWNFLESCNNLENFTLNQNTEISSNIQLQFSAFKKLKYVKLNCNSCVLSDKSFINSPIVEFYSSTIVNIPESCFENSKLNLLYCPQVTSVNRHSFTNLQLMHIQLGSKVCLHEESFLNTEFEYLDLSLNQTQSAFSGFKNIKAVNMTIRDLQITTNYFISGRIKELYLPDLIHLEYIDNETNAELSISYLHLPSVKIISSHFFDNIALDALIFHCVRQLEMMLFMAVQI